VPWQSDRGAVREALIEAKKINGVDLGPATLTEQAGASDSNTWFCLTGTWRLYARFLASVAAIDPQTSDILDFNMNPREAGDGVMHFFFMGCELVDIRKGNGARSE
jgi:hypothetical protein